MITEEIANQDMAASFDHEHGLLRFKFKSSIELAGRSKLDSI
jgi:hypothetical protein